MKDLTALRSRWHAQNDAARDGRHGDLRAQNKLRVGREHFGVQILAVALEPWILRDFEDHVDIPAPPTAHPGIAYTAERHVLTGGNAGRNVNLDLTIRAYATVASTLLARRRDHCALAFARRTRRN